MKALSCLLKRAIGGGFLSACQVRGRGGEGLADADADDTLLFYEASQN